MLKNVECEMWIFFIIHPTLYILHQAQPFFYDFTTLFTKIFTKEVYNGSFARTRFNGWPVHRT